MGVLQGENYPDWLLLALDSCVSSKLPSTSPCVLLSVSSVIKRLHTFFLNQILEQSTALV